MIAAATIVPIMTSVVGRPGDPTPSVVSGYSTPRLGDAASMASLIRCVALSYAASKFYESVRNNKDLWIDELWGCYHSYGNYGSYCVVGAYTIIQTAFDLARRAGSTCLHRFPTRPEPGSSNRERTLYGNVYRTYLEIERAGVVPVGRQPEVGAVFFRASNESGHNHAGIVVATPLRDDHYITTVEANTTVSGGSSTPKGFVAVDYTREAYERYEQRSFTRSGDAAKHYSNTDVRGWRFAYMHRMCTLAAMPIVPSDYRACLGVSIICESDSAIPVAPAPPCDPTNPPPQDETGSWGPWQLFANVYPRTYRTAEGILVGEIRPSRTRSGTTDPTAPHVSDDGCWVRFPAKHPPIPPNVPPPLSVEPCKEKLLLRSACDPDDGQGRRTVLRFGGTDVVTLDDLRDDGVCEALMSSVIRRDDHMRRGYSQKAKTVYDYVPMVAMSNANVFILSDSSEMYKIFEQFSLWGPDPVIVRHSRTGYNDGTGGGWAERLGRWLKPDGPALSWINDTESSLDTVLSRQDATYTTFGLYEGLWLNTKRYPSPPKRTIGGPAAVYTGYRNGHEISLHNLMVEFNKRAADSKRNLVILWTGEPITVWDVIKGPLSVISSVIPGVGPVFNTIASSIDIIRNTGSSTVEVLFALTTGIAGALGNGVLGERPFGVDPQVFRSIVADAKRAETVYRTVVSAGSVSLQSAIAVARAFDVAFPEYTQGIRNAMLDAERWSRNAVAEIDREWNGILGDVRAAVHSVASAKATEKAVNLLTIQSGAESLFAKLIGESSGGPISATQLPFLQDLLQTVADPALLGMVPGMGSVVGQVMRVPSIFVNDVQASVTHSALAALATGKKAVDGALDALVLSSLINKAEDFARRGWEFTMPMTLPPDKADCFAHEVRVVTGQECCAPRRLVCGTCMDTNQVQPCPPGQYRDSDGCCVEPAPIPNPAPRQGPDSGTTSGGGGTVVSGNGGIGITGGGTVGSVTRPPVLPDCIRMVSGQPTYCPPAYCRLDKRPDTPRPTPPPATRREEAVIMMRNMNGGAFELRMRRTAGTTTWDEFAARAMQPSGSSWLPGQTAFTTIAIGDIIPGVTVTSADLESMRASQQAPITPVPEASPTGSQSAPAMTTTAAAPLAPVSTGNVPISIGNGSTSACAVMYPARYVAEPHGRWQALIATRWTDLVDCCPVSEETCCGDTRNDIAALRTMIESTQALVRQTATAVQSMAVRQRTLAADVGRLIESVSRMGAGEPIDLSDLRADIAYIKANLPQQQTQYDDTRLLRRIDDLDRAIAEIRPTASYDDTVLRRDIADVRQLVQMRCTAVQPIAYDQRFDTLEAMIRNIVIPPPVVTPTGTVAQPQAETMSILLNIQRSIAQLRTAAGPTYDRELADLKAMIAALPTSCPSCAGTDLTAVTDMLRRIESNTARNYDAQFAAIRSLIADIRMEPPVRYDERFDDLARRIDMIRTAEAGATADRFAAIEAIVADIRRSLPKDRNYDQWLQAIEARLASLNTTSQPLQVAPGQVIVEREKLVPLNCDYRWDEVLSVLNDIRTLASRPTPQQESFAPYYEALQRIITDATNRTTTAYDGRFDELRSLVGGLRTALPPSCPVPPADPRLDQILRLITELQATSATQTASIVATRQALTQLTTEQGRMNAAYERAIQDLRSTIATDGGTMDQVASLDALRSDWAHQQERYAFEIGKLTQRIEVLRSEMADHVRTMQSVRPPSTPPTVAPPTVAPPTVAPPPLVPPGAPPHQLPTPPRFDTPPRVDAPPRTDVPARPNDCPDCPTVVERHERIIYGPLPTAWAHNGTPPCDDCDEPC